VRVLIVDDDVDTRVLLQTILASSGAETEVAGSAEEALRAIARKPPDVLLSDIEMPGQSGLDLLRRVRALDPARGGAVPAGAVTAYAHPRDRERALQAGFMLHIPKPFDPVELCAIVAVLARAGARPAP
jgi:CheY-like chemotaxis protein